jgi:hypothetical protein
MSTKDALYATFENIPTRRGRGGEYAYVRWQDVADRMNQVFGTNWSSNVEYQDVVGGNIIVRVRVLVTNPETNNTQFQEGFGGAPNDDRNEAGNAFKAAYSKALKDACKKWGVALYLDEEGESASYGGPHITPPSHMSTPPAGYSGFETAPTATPSPPPAPSTAEPQPEPQPTSATPPANTGGMTSGGMAPPPGVEMSAPIMQPSAEPVQQNTPPPPSMPTTPAPATPPAQALPQDLPMSKTPPIAPPGGGEDLISDVQKAALQSILSMQGVEYETLVREAFETNGLDGKNIPNQDALTYTQAVYVVKYGNDKFRNR